MNVAMLQRYRERLLDERRHLAREIDHILEVIPEEVNPPGEHEIAPSEGIDVEISRAMGDGSRLDDIDAALNRMKEGTFGRCCACGEEIPAKRLDAIPDTRYCMRCVGSLYGLEDRA